MKRILSLILFSLTINLIAQVEPVPDFKISEIKVIPFDSKTGEFKEAINENRKESYFNAISISLFVVVEISGKAGIFESYRQVEIQVFEGKKIKVKKIEKNMLFGGNGKFYISLLLDPLICGDIAINARVIGQKKDSSLTKKIPFKCGE